MTDQLKWWQKTLVYEVYPKTFCDSNGDGIGDIRGIISKLDYLQDLGIGAIWLAPVYASPMRDNGYDVSDYYNINPMFGTMDDMDELIKKSGERNIRIVMDLVFNHTSDVCEWFKESSKDRCNDKSDWYIWRDPDENGHAPNNWRGIFGGSVWEYCENRKQYYMHTFDKTQPDLNWENPEVRNELYKISNYWLDKGIGGFRIDAITYIKKPAGLKGSAPDGIDGMCSVHEAISNTPGILDYLHEFKTNVVDGKDIFTVGEANGVPAEELNEWVGKSGVFDMIFRFDLVNIQFSDQEIWYLTKDFSLKDIKSVISREQMLTAGDGWCPVFFENHDQPRSINHFFLHDDNAIEKAKVLGTVLLTMRGTPFIYQGEELGMCNAAFKSIGDFNDISTINQYHYALNNGISEETALKCVCSLSRDNARTPVLWNKVIDNDVLAWYKTLNDLRSRHPVLCRGNYEELLKESETIFAYRRTDETGAAVIIVNFSDTKTEYPAEILNGCDEIISTAGIHSGVLFPYECIIAFK